LRNEKFLEGKKFKGGRLTEWPPEAAKAAVEKTRRNTHTDVGHTWAGTSGKRSDKQQLANHIIVRVGQGWEEKA